MSYTLRFQVVSYPWWKLVLLQVWFYFITIWKTEKLFEIQNFFIFLVEATKLMFLPSYDHKFTDKKREIFFLLHP